DPRPDQVLAEDAALREERVVGLERVERLRERTGNLRDAAVVLEQVEVRRRPRVDAALDAVEPGHQHRREREVRIRGRIRTAELDPLRLRRLAVRRDADARAAAPRRGRGVYWLHAWRDAEYTRRWGAPSCAAASRRYEFVVGAQNASSAGAWASSPATYER